jgi:hypothetical protein
MSPINGNVTVGGLTFSAQLFRTGFASGHGPCRCASTCCMSGVFLDLGERDRILEHAEEIARAMDATQDRRPASWFDSEEIADNDFPSGRSVGTAVVNDKCAFLDQNGRCSAQVAAVEAGLDRWAWKPHYCILFPIEVSAGVVSFDDMLQEDESCCTVSRQFEVPLFRACRDEIVHLVGEDGYRELEEHYGRLQQHGAKSAR